MYPQLSDSCSRRRSRRCSPRPSASAQLSTADLTGRVTDPSGARAAGRHRHRHADRHRPGRARPSPMKPAPTCSPTCRPVRTGSKSRSQASAPTCRPASCCRSAPRRRSTPRSRVGNLEETVTVEAAAPLVDVRSAGISEVVENERIVELPLQGRQVTSLLVLAGAAVDTGAVNPRYNPGGVSISVGGGLVLRRRLPARRRDAQRSVQQPEPPAAVPRRAPGVQRRHERPDGAERHALRRVGERRHQVGHQPVVRQRVRVPARPPLQRHQSVRRRRAPTASAWTTGCGATSSAARSAVRSSATGCSSSAPTRARSCGRRRPPTSRSCRPRRCWPATSPPSRRRRATRDGRLRCARRSSTTGSIPRCSARRR